MGTAIGGVAANARDAVSEVARGAFAACGTGVRRKTRAATRCTRAIVRDGRRKTAAVLHVSTLPARVRALPKEPRRACEAVGRCVARVAVALADARALGECGAPVGAVRSGAAGTRRVRQRAVGVGTQAAIRPIVQ